MHRVWLACVALCACVAPESGNPAQRCDDSSSCEVDQFCYRGFCVGDESQQVDPVSGDDDASPPGLGERDAAAMFDATLAPPDAVAPDAAPVDEVGIDAGPGTAGRDAAVRDAAVRDAAVRDAAVRDAGRRDAGKPRPDAGNTCAIECKPPDQNSSPCKKCLKSAFGEDGEELCGKPDGDDDEQLEAAEDPFCVSLCLGAASKHPSCAPLQLCNGSKCGGKP